MYLGQAYVALSRASSAAGLRIVNLDLGMRRPTQTSSTPTPALALALALALELDLITLALALALALTRPLSLSLALTRALTRRAAAGAYTAQRQGDAAQPDAR